MESNLLSAAQIIGFWGLLIIYIVKDGIIPISNRYFPSRIKANEVSQQMEFKAQEFNQQMRLREVEAMENIARLLVATNERLSAIEDTQQAIVARMPVHLQVKRGSKTTKSIK